MCAGGACVLACVGMGWGYTREEVLGRNCRFLQVGAGCARVVRVY